MKINTTVTSQPNKATTGQDTGSIKNDAAAAQSNGKNAGGDKVTLSEAARLIDDPGRVSISHPAPDQLRIDEIKQQLNAGTFTTEPARIADKFFQFLMNQNQETDHV